MSTHAQLYTKINLLLLMASTAPTVHSVPCTVVVPTGVAPARVSRYFEPLVTPLSATVKTEETGNR